MSFYNLYNKEIIMFIRWQNYEKKPDSPNFSPNMPSIDCIFHIIYAFYRRHIAKKMMEKMLCWTIFA